MVYTDRNHLTVIEVNSVEEPVGFERIEAALIHRTANMIYCEKGGLLCGIISMGDIMRAYDRGARAVCLNTKFTKFYGFEFIKAKNLFAENAKINSIPIVDRNGYLLGDYTRWDDINFSPEVSLIYRTGFMKRQLAIFEKVYFVRPSGDSIRKHNLMEKWVEFFTKAGSFVTVLDYEDLVREDHTDGYVIFTDQDEIRGKRTCLAAIRDKEFTYWRWITLTELAVFFEDDYADRTADSIIGNAIKSLKEKGVNVILMDRNRKDSSYWKKLEEELDKKYEKDGTDRKKEQQSLNPLGVRKAFFKDLYSEEYANEIRNPGYVVERHGMETSIVDKESKYFNYKNGERRTVGQPNDYVNSIFFFGPCVVLGSFVEDKHTIESFLQKSINEDGAKYRVVNLGAWENSMSRLIKLVKYKYKPGDIVVIYYENKQIEGVPIFYLEDSAKNANISPDWISNALTHCNYIVSEIYAKDIKKIIDENGMLNEHPGDGSFELTSIQEEIEYKTYIDRYFFDFDRSGIIGSIVMNCNPFTLGHRYLIEEALKKVDKLIIFVVEEDESIFSFMERFMMVKEGTKDLGNVYVVPSGYSILSRKTFPEYFVKIVDGDLQKNVRKDITIFAEKIAPRLNIRYRFVGEEKNDEVTNEYNSAMKEILPGKGIELIEIKRKEINTNSGDAISATTVRKRLEKLDENTKLNDLLPKTTIENLTQSWF